MDLQKLISDVLEKLNLDKGLIKKFQKDPMSVVKSLLNGIDLNGDQLKAIIEGVTAKLNLDGLLKDGGGILDKIKSFLGM